MIRIDMFFDIGKAAYTVVTILGQNLSDFADISLALIALHLVGWVDDVLNFNICT